MLWSLVRTCVPIACPAQRLRPVGGSSANRKSIHADCVLTFQAMKLTASTMVGWTISLPGKTPQVRAFGPSLCVFVLKSPRLLIA